MRPANLDNGALVANNRDRIPILFSESELSCGCAVTLSLALRPTAANRPWRWAMPKRVLDVAAIIRRLDFGNLPQRGGRNSCSLARAARL